MNELQDESFDLAIHKALELKHMKKNMKRNVQEAKSSSHVVKRNKKDSVFSLIHVTKRILTLWIIDFGATNHACNSL